MAELEWIIIKGWTAKGQGPIGAVGMLGNTAATVAAFYDDRDANRDGRTSLGERIAFRLSPLRLDGMAVVDVAMTARYDMKILQRDPDFYHMASQLFLNFANRLVLDGIYTVYISRGVKLGAAGVAASVTSSAIKQMVIKKGMETAVKRAIQNSY